MSDQLLSLIYLSLLLVFTGCMFLCDHRWKLAFFRDKKRASFIAFGTVAVFLVWDALGIATGTFYRGDSPYMTGIELAPEMPIEEPIFLFFLVYLTLNLTSAVARFFGAPLPRDSRGKI